MNIVEILKYCPKGMELYSLVHGKVTFECISSDKVYPIMVNRLDDLKSFTEEGKYFVGGGECVLFPSENQRSWEDFRLPIKKGDIMMSIDGKSPFIASGKITFSCPEFICGIDEAEHLRISHSNYFWTTKFYIPATEEVKTKLFAAIEKAGYRWNSETLELEQIKQVDEVITDFESARKALGLETNDGFRPAIWLTGEDPLYLSKVSHFVNDINPEHAEALIALNKLFTIAQAWNKEDGFVPDFSDWNQDKWFPWFKYDKDAAGFVFEATDNPPADVDMYFGSRLCFESSERAEQFGKQFVDLYNKVFL